jgi:hypothetical protein
MKETEVELTDEGFEEITGDEKKENKTGNWKPGTGNSKPATGNPTQGTGNWKQDSGGGNRPDFRVVQADRDKDGNSMYVNVGGMWKNISKSGNEFYTLKIGQLKLLVFPNTNK